MQYLFPLLAVFIWAGNTVVNKLAVGIIQPAEIGFFRWLLEKGQRPREQLTD